jgi:hypothetical protein
VILILDTNAMFSRAELQGVGWGAVKNAVTEGALTVIVPRVVVAELTARTRDERSKLRPSTRLVHNAPSAVREAFEDAVVQVDLWAQSYDAEAVMRGAGFTIVPTPVVDHDALSQRAIDRIAPFDTNGGGYRDALHWHSVLEQVRAHPDEQIVFISDDAGFRLSKASPKLDPHLEREVDAILTTGTFDLVQSLSDFDVPGKYAGESMATEITDERLAELLAELFTDGKLRTPDLWEAMVGREEALDADLSYPKAATVTFAATRPLVDGGAELRVGIRLTADVLFDWDYPDEASRQPLEITARFVLDTNGNLTPGTAEDVIVHPVPVMPQETASGPNERPSRSSGSATGWAFDTWISGQFGKSIGLPDVDALAGVNLSSAAQVAGFAAGMLSMSDVIGRTNSAAATGVGRTNFAVPSIVTFLPIVPPVIKAVTASSIAKDVTAGITRAIGTSQGPKNRRSKPATPKTDETSSGNNDAAIREEPDSPAE